MASSANIKDAGDSSSKSKGDAEKKVALHKGDDTTQQPASITDDDENDHAVGMDRGLLSQKRVRVHDEDELPRRSSSRKEWMRPYWLGTGLFLVLFSFWLLDTLKDPIFGALVAGNLDRHQPPAKLFSVCTTLALVCFLEYISNERKRRQQQAEKERSKDDVLDASGNWNRMSLQYGGADNTDDWIGSSTATEDRVPSAIFAYIGVPYCLVFGLMAYLLQFNPAVALTDAASTTADPASSKRTFWRVVGYFLYAAIESFGSIAVATFWSFVNSSLSLQDAERYYGLIIAIAQLGAIAGSTMVTTHIWNNITLIILACLIILLHILVMASYSRHFQPTSSSDRNAAEPAEQPISSSSTPTLWSGVYLILKYNYVLLILGASCLYEVSLTCLNYQMTLLGWTRFEETAHEPLSFTQFMGHYGQMVNISSLALSSIVFPFLIRRLGLRLTIRLFPTLLLLANIVAFGALPGNLAVLFFSMSLLKAMTYSIHDPSKEILYLPTSNAIKFKSKFWIDVVGARVAKAIGSSINTLSGSVDRSIRVASAPSLLTAAALWVVCYRVGTKFDQLVESETVVGTEPSPGRMSKYEYDKLTGEHNEDREDSMFEDPLAPSAELSPLRSS